MSISKQSNESNKVRAGKENKASKWDRARTARKGGKSRLCTGARRWEYQK
jgi:hypothetical protein